MAERPLETREDPETHQGLLVFGSRDAALAFWREYNAQARELLKLREQLAELVARDPTHHFQGPVPPPHGTGVL